METPQEKPKAKPKKTLTGVGTIDPPESVRNFVLTCEPLGPEADWLKLGRPFWVIRYTVRSPGGGESYAHARTNVPACVPLKVGITCPSHCIDISAGITVGKESVFRPCDYTLVENREAGSWKLKSIGGQDAAWYFWDHSGDHRTHQRFANAATGEPELEPQYAADSPPKAKPAKKKGKPKLPGECRVPTPDEQAAIANDFPGLTSVTDSTDIAHTLTQESPPCPSTSSTEPSTEHPSDQLSKPSTEPSPSPR